MIYQLKQKKKRGTAMPRCKLTVLRKPESADMEITVHAKRAEPLHFTCTFVLKISQVFNLQDKHNASFYQNVLTRLLPHRHKSTKTFQYSAHYHQIICFSTIKVVHLYH